MRNRLFLFAFLVIFFLQACSYLEGSSSSSSLAGEWSLTELNGKPVLAGSTVTIKFEDGDVGGSSGCNSYGGKYTTGGEKLSFSSMMSTMMACIAPQGVMEQESAYLQSLDHVAAYAVAGDRLELMNSSGETVLAFTR